MVAILSCLSFSCLAKLSSTHTHTQTHKSHLSIKIKLTTNINSTNSSINHHLQSTIEPKAGAGTTTCCRVTYTGRACLFCQVTLECYATSQIGRWQQRQQQQQVGPIDLVSL